MNRFLAENGIFLDALQSRSWWGWCIDGTCATGKSSFGTPHKASRLIRLPHRNSHLGSSLGFTWSAIHAMQTVGGEYALWDRTPFNNLTWYQIWLCLCDPDHHTWQQASARLQNLYEFYGAMSANVIVIDSNVKRSLERLRHRNQGSDAQRSTWNAYIEIQNFFYQDMCRLVPRYFCLIDLDWFGGEIDQLHRVLWSLVRGHAPMLPYSITYVELNETLKDLYSRSSGETERKRPVETEVFKTDLKNAHGKIKHLHPAIRYYVRMRPKDRLRNYAQITPRRCLETSTLCRKRSTTRSRSSRRDHQSTSHRHRALSR